MTKGRKKREWWACFAHSGRKAMINNRFSTLEESSFSKVFWGALFWAPRET